MGRAGDAHLRAPSEPKGSCYRWHATSERNKHEHEGLGGHPRRLRPLQIENSAKRKKGEAVQPGNPGGRFSGLLAGCLTQTKKGGTPLERICSLQPRSVPQRRDRVKRRWRLNEAPIGAAQTCSRRARHAPRSGVSRATAPECPDPIFCDEGRVISHLAAVDDHTFKNGPRNYAARRRLD